MAVPPLATLWFDGAGASAAPPSPPMPSDFWITLRAFLAASPIRKLAGAGLQALGHSEHCNSRNDDCKG
eukprot:8598166-Pyramimonas_sp.AAC.1